MFVAQEKVHVHEMLKLFTTVSRAERPTGVVLKDADCVLEYCWAIASVVDHNVHESSIHGAVKTLQQNHTNY